MDYESNLAYSFLRYLKIQIILTLFKMKNKTSRKKYRLQICNIGKVKKIFFSLIASLLLLKSELAIRY